jgi:hypothetical protein
MEVEDECFPAAFAFAFLDWIVAEFAFRICAVAATPHTIAAAINSPGNIRRRFRFDIASLCRA